jgi:hypothetical protein
VSSDRLLSNTTYKSLILAVVDHLKLLVFHRWEFQQRNELAHAVQDYLDHATA